jgi:hypothetical protein
VKCELQQMQRDGKISNALWPSELKMVCSCWCMVNSLCKWLEYNNVRQHENQKPNNYITTDNWKKKKKSLKIPKE